MSCRLALAQQQPGDDEPRNDEEDLDTDVAAAEGGYAGVVDESQEDGDSAQSLHVGTKATISRWSSRLVAGDRGSVDGDRHHYGCEAPPERSGLPHYRSRPPTTA